MDSAAQEAWDKYGAAALTFNALDKFLTEHFKGNAELKKKWIDENSEKLAKVPAAEALHDEASRLAASALEMPSASLTKHEDTCVVCLDRPRDAAFTHGDTAHVCCCLACAKAIHSSRGVCPLCRAPVEAVLRVYNTAG